MQGYCVKEIKKMSDGRSTSAPVYDSDGFPRLFRTRRQALDWIVEAEGCPYPLGPGQCGYDYHIMDLSQPANQRWLNARLEGY